jgi:hypothetical protein
VSNYRGRAGSWKLRAAFSDRNVAQSYCDMERAKGDTFPICVDVVELDMPSKCNVFVRGPSAK